MKHIAVLLSFLFLLVAAFPQTAQSGLFTRNASPTQNLAVTSVDGGNRHNFKVELALTPREQAKGLMNRAAMAEDAGMLFYFGKEAPRSFWMKNTLISLDIIFIRADGVISTIHHNAKPLDLTSLPSQGPAAAALEIGGGMAEKLGIKEGDVVHHMFFGNALAQ